MFTDIHRKNEVQEQPETGVYAGVIFPSLQIRAGASKFM